MAFLDEIVIQAQGGRGGDGVVRWRQEKFVAKGGPSGGDGGRGGDIIIRAVRSLRVLDQYRSKKEFIAMPGEAGGNRNLKGASGSHTTIDFPIGSVITNVTNGMKWELTKEGQEIKILKGGAGGYGNVHFKSSTNQTPKECTPGKEGEAAELHIEISLIADVGLLGFPNAGKSSLLNALTNTDAKVGAYPFTTIDPNLGDFFGFIIADIPGLIEGASDGKGLGTKFLRHLSKTKILVHLVSFEQPDMMASYEAIRKEVGTFDPELLNKQEIILLTKTDVSTPDDVAKAVKQFKKLGKEVYAVTLFDDSVIKDFLDSLVKTLKKDTI